MFEELFTDRNTIEKYRTAPLPGERLRYLAHCARTGSRPGMLRRIAVHQVHLVHLLDLREGERTNASRIAAAAGRWSQPGGRRSRRPADPEARRRFISYAVRWLRFADLLEEPCAKRHAHAGEVAVFAAWMRKERGWSEDTVRCCLDTVERFFFGLDERGVALASIGIADIDREIARYRARACSRVTIHDYAQHLRTFFRFAERRGWCAQDLADGIMPSRFHPGETLPKGLEREEVVRLLDTTAGDRPADVRDRAVLMLLITYGLRSGEVAGLQLDDLDWEEETLRVRRPKPGRTHRYPLSRSAGEAIVRYIREVRPVRPERALFLTLNAPIRPLSRCAVWHAVSSRLRRLGITGKRRGPHALRHAAAQHLLDHGLSMKEVGDYLGHRSVSATSAYARVRLDALREVAEVDLEGLT